MKNFIFLLFCFSNILMNAQSTGNYQVKAEVLLSKFPEESDLSGKLKKLGVLNQKYEYEPYRANWIFNKDVVFLGGKILWYSETMVEEYVGCCPDPDQFGIVLQNADMKIAEDFCRKKNLKMAPFADYIYNIPNKYQNVDKSKLIFISTN